MALDPAPSRPWWKEPMVWLVAGLPATAVIASFTTYFIAAHNPDSLVKADYRKEGLAVVSQLTDADKAAAAMGLIAHLSVRNGQIEVTLKGRLTATPRRVSLNIVHPTQDNQDIHILLDRSHDLSYIVPVPNTGSGKRILVLEPEDQAWRISGQWMAPFSGMTELVAEGSKPSTHP
ncbi:MAG: hypothetical protein COW48_10750 [Hydrogenophilales bacterium CG17_big_fil_post_rev_8_21_14_2_50_63_12]|nr:MAG: hypothetical protein COW48_10750 [Hydrogenophilales bacterium CG17_big_fil_post_rev_8_21_14_2_50_63_12]PIX98274.1 MAG: hypothetical protein COZ24_00975 [Hydrogenophilales bacterium CG_4_10_14_3_um_filter_63_21]PJB07309.1 MAG: hypothetical protein CO126_01160 [Hydrogenophilales bacterium CG_4_9_14_3_um_filter_63_34]